VCDRLGETHMIFTGADGSCFDGGCSLVEVVVMVGRVSISSNGNYLFQFI